MESSISFTEYELGHRLYWVLRTTPPSTARQINIRVLLAVPIVEDDTEAWLESVPEGQRISREDALATLEDHRPKLVHCLENALVAAADLFLSEQGRIRVERDRLESESIQCEAQFHTVVERFLGRSLAVGDLESLFAQLPDIRSKVRMRREASRERFFDEMQAAERARRAAETPLEKWNREFLQRRDSPEAAEAKEAERRAHAVMAEVIKKQERRRY